MMAKHSNMKKLYFLFFIFLFYSQSFAQWTQVSSFPIKFVKDILISNNVVCVGTSNSGVYISTDSMASFQQFVNDINFYPANMVTQILSFDNKLYISTGDGIYTSTNGGTNWIKKSNGIVVGGGALYVFAESIYEFNGTMFTGTHTGIYRSTNSGENWIVTNISGSHVGAKNFTHHFGKLFAARESINTPYGYYSTDSGITWNFLTALNLPTITFFSEPGKLWSGTIHGVWLSTSNGASWEHRSAGLSLDPYNSSIIRINQYLLTSVKFGGSGIFISENEGLQWADAGNGLPFLSEISELMVFNDNVIAATSNGLYKRPVSQLTGVAKTHNQLPEIYLLSQNYPNPFNPTTNIKFDIPKSSFIKIIIYNVQGKEITTLVNERLNAGSYEVNWNGGSFPSGLYFYKLITAEFFDVKKMLMIK